MTSSDSELWTIAAAKEISIDATVEAIGFSTSWLTTDKILTSTAHSGELHG